MLYRLYICYLYVTDIYQNKGMSNNTLIQNITTFKPG